MARDLNRCEFIGRLGQDPDIKYSAAGDAVANISIAVGKSWVDKNTNEKHEQTEWVRIVAFKQLAKIMGEYLKKGSKIFVAGEFRTRKWQDQNGQDRWTTEIVANDMIMLDGKPAHSDRAQQQADAYRPTSNSNQPPPHTDSDIPGDDGFDDLPF